MTTDTLMQIVSNASSRTRALQQLFEVQTVSTDDLIRFGEERIHEERGSSKETFVPIFTTNHCDSECLMCGMRKGNARLNRKFTGRNKIREQLEILMEVDGVKGVGFLTGEFEGDYVRKANAFVIGWAIREALDMGFESVYFNIGSMTPDEVEVLAEWLEPEEPVTMCVFQETYQPNTYSKFMGSRSEAIPKSDFSQRIESFNVWLDAGFRRVNPGFLVGLHGAVIEDAISLVQHVESLLAGGAEVRLSLPRLRPASGSDAKLRVSDDEYARILAAIACVLPECRIVLTTRETAELQRRLLPITGVLSPGSPDVAPYRRESAAPNSEDTSQFLIPDLRRPREILTGVVELGYDVAQFELAGTEDDDEIDR